MVAPWKLLSPGRRGTIMVLLSAIFFGAMPLFAQIAYNGGTDAVGLLTIRFVASAVILLPFLALLRGRFPDPARRGLALLALIAFFGAQSLCFFASVEYNGAITAVLLFFTYPLLTTAVSVAFFGEELGWPKFAALAIGFAGVALSIRGPAASFGFAGLLLGVGSSVLFSATTLTAKHILGRHGDPSEMMALVYAGSAPAFALVFALSGASFPSGLSGWAAIAGVVVIGTIAAMGLFFAGLDHLPAGTAGMLSSLEPPMAVALAAVFLGESINAVQCLGVVLVVGSIVLLTRLTPEEDPLGPAP